MKRFINNVLIILSALIIAVSFSWVFSNRVEAVTNGSVTVKLAPDSSKQKESKVLIVNVSLAGFKNVNLNTIISYVKDGETHHFMDDYDNKAE